MNKNFIILILAVLMFLFIYSQIQRAFLPPTLKIAYEELDKHPEEKRVIISDDLYSLYPVGAEKNLVINDLTNSKFSGSVVTEDGTENFYGDVYFSSGFDNFLMLQDRKISIRVKFEKDKLIEIEAYAFR